jgi:hypothetical protein
MAEVIDNRWAWRAGGNGEGNRVPAGRGCLVRRGRRACGIFVLPNEIKCLRNLHAHAVWQLMPTAKKSAPKKKRKMNAAFAKPVQPDDKLAAVVGSKPLPRTELTKKLWEYIRKHKLQDSKNRRNINADANLKPVFNGKSTVSMFEMTKLVNKHVKA